MIKFFLEHIGFGDKDAKKNSKLLEYPNFGIVTFKVRSSYKELYPVRLLQIFRQCIQLDYVRLNVFRLHLA